MAKKLGIAALVVLLIVGVVLGVLWQRLTALPDWYEDPAMIAEDGSPQVDRDWVRIPDGQARAGEQVLRNPHLRPSKTTAPVQKAIKRSRASYKSGELEAGAVINLSEMDLESLSAKDRAQYQATIEAFPALTGRDVYVGVEGGVAGSDGSLALGPKTKLRVGDTSYSLATVAKRLGISEGELRAAIEGELGRMDFELPTGAGPLGG